MLNNQRINEVFGLNFELIVDAFFEGQFNMDFDYERTLECSKGNSPAMIRFYGWNPWTVSLGYNQNESDIDKALLADKGFGLVRRPTGGRAVLHADELTYSIVMPLPKKYTVHDAYREIHIILLDGLKKLGAPALDFEKSQTDFRDLYQKQPGMSVSCFASAARYEISYDNRKVVGSAQRLFGNTLLQHGSILLGKGHEQLADVTAVENNEKRDILRKYILSHSATLEESCGRKISFDESLDCILSVL